jgi:tetratricopeptide (TPR) repeat protein
VEISINNKYTYKDELFLAAFTEIAGFNYHADKKKYGDWWNFSIDTDIKIMLKALYKVPSGYNLVTGKVFGIIWDGIGRTIRLTSTPSGASVSLDGIFKGVCPITLNEVATGKHLIKITKTGYQDYQQEITVSSSKYYYYSANLSPITTTKAIDKLGNILLFSTPSGAKIYLDNKYKGITPQTLSKLNLGNYQLRLTKPGYHDYQQKVTVSSEKTTEVLTKLTAIPPSYAKIKVTSTPSFAKIYLNDTYKGTTPLTINQLKPGDYQLKLSKEGYQDWSKKVTIVTSKTNTFSISLIAIPKPAPVYGQLSINSTPAAQVFLNNKTKGATPLTLDNMEPDIYTLKLTREGYEDWEQEVSIAANQITKVNIYLKKDIPSYGSIRITSKPEKAEVYLNDILKGITPLTLYNLTPGIYHLKLKLSGYQDYTQQVKVTALTTNVLPITLLVIPPKYGQLSINSTPSAQVYINDQEKGTTPLTLDNLEPGTYQLKLTKEGYEAWQQEVQVKVGETTQITATLSLIPEDKEYQKFFQQGRDYYDAGFYKRAVPLFRQALNIDDTDWELHYYLGQTYQALEDYNPAIEYYQNAITLKPREYMLYFNLGNIYNQITLYRDAIEVYERAIQINPEPDILYTRIGIACRNAVLPSDAIRFHKKAISINPLNSSSYAYLADIYFDNDLYALALESYREANRIDPNNEQLHFRMGRTYYKDGQYTDAKSYLNRAIGTDETYADAYYFLGLTYIALEDKDSALKQYEILKKLDASLAEKLKELVGE